MHEKVIIIGGGVGGLTAAHELIDRGFDVHVFERRRYCGGKAASYRQVRNKVKGPPREHGFRFFPGWYRHLPDTMKRIPYRGKRTYYEGASVYDNLVSVETNLLTWTNRDPLPLPLRPPRNLSDAAAIGQLLSGLGALGLTTQEVALFARKLLAIVAMSEEERLAQLDGMTWWAYLECDQPGKSDAYRDLVSSSIRTSIAAKAEEVSAYTVGRLAIRSLIDTLSTVDRVLNGPTNEAWIDPWVKHLKNRGVVFHLGEELDGIDFNRDTNDVKRVTFVPFWVSELRRLRRLLLAIVQQRRTMRDDPFGEADLEWRKRADRLNADVRAARDVVIRIRRERLLADVEDENVIALLTELRRDLQRVASKKSPPEDVRTTWEKLDDTLGAAAEVLVKTEAEVGTDGARQKLGESDYFVFALPLEQMAYHVNRSPMMVTLDPDLRGIVDLTSYLEWMAGIQFYLRETFDFVPGHLVGVDSEWGLTAIEQTQFWRDVELPQGVRAILSVDISAWDKQGRFVRKDAFNCKNDEIATEVWKQLKSLVDRKRRASVLRDGMLVGGRKLRGKGKKQNYYLDESIVDIHDRKKQALYEKARSVKYSEINRRTDVTPYAWGPRRLRFNVEPLLINRVGSRQFRPEARTGIRNMFLAADYVKTDTDLACMEGANEAGRRAVNGILEATGSDERRCQLWPFSVSRELSASLLLARGGAATTAIDVARFAAVGARKKVLRMLNPEIAGRRLFAWPTDGE